MSDLPHPGGAPGGPPLSDDAALRLSALVEQFHTERSDGSSKSIGEFSQMHPEVSNDLAGVLQVINSLKRIGADQRQQERLVDEPASDIPRRLGDFQILREIGRGGMGIVFEAEQLSLKRRVALKILPRRSCETREIQRFTNEARIAASFHHSNIVPVFAFGESDGYYYFAMQIIAGHALGRIANHVGEVAQVCPDITSPRWIAKAGIQIADALHYAHQCGTLHRDIKPNNLLLDENGRVWISDFGVACILTQDDDGFVGRSGTLPYQAPERLSGKCDERSEVYSLGMTLLEVACAIEGQKRGSPPEVCQSLRDSSRSKRLPVDLQSLLRKAIQVDPNARYESAAAMAADLRRYLEGWPVQARRHSRVRSFGCWARRNPPLAASLMTVAALIGVTLCVLVVSRIHVEQLNRQLTNANQDLTEQNQSLTRASFAIDAFVRNAVANIETADESFQPSTSATNRHKARLSSGVRTLLEGLTPDDLRLESIDRRAEQEVLLAVSAPRRVGHIMYSLGHLAEAEAASRYSLELIQRASSIPGVPANLLQLRRAQVLNDLADIEENRLKFDSAETLHQQALTELTAIEHVPDYTHYDFEHCRTHLGMVYAIRNRWASLLALRMLLESRRVPGASVALGEAATTKSHLDESLKFLIAEQYRSDRSVNCCVLTGRCLIERAQNPEALTLDRERDFKMGIHFLEIASLETAWNPRFVHELARGLAAVPLSGWDETAPDRRVASASLKLAHRLATKIAADSPKSPEFMVTLADASHRLGILASLDGDDETALEYLQSAVQTQGALLSQFPDNAPLFLNQAIYRKTLAVHLQQLDRVQEAEAAERNAKSELERLPQRVTEHEPRDEVRLLVQAGVRIERDK